MTFRVVISVDPGVQGALAVVADGKFVEFLDMPVMMRSTKGQEINGRGVADFIAEIRRRFPGADLLAVLEQVNAMPPRRGENGEQRSAGTQSSFNFGEGFGKIKGVLEALHIPYQLVHPARWKKAAGLTGKEKDAARTLAIQRCPSAAEHLKLKKHIGRADALLIAEWAFTTEQIGHKPAPSQEAWPE